MYQQGNDNRYEEYIAEHIKKGTTTCALTCKDGVVLAADTRASAGFFIADKHVMKIQKVDNHIGMTMAGGVADAQNVLSLGVILLGGFANPFYRFHLILRHACACKEADAQVVLSLG